MNGEEALKVSFEERELNGAGNPTFFGTPLSASNYSASSNRWNPFARRSGIFSVIHAHCKRNRVVSKHGKLNTYRKPEENDEQHRYLKDFFTSMIGATWQWTILSFAASFFSSWLLFAIIWYLVAYAHGDLVEDIEEGHSFCVENIKDFTSCFLFSIETQHTIGYGVRVTTEECPMAVFVMSVQSIVGVIIQACMAGIVFAKFTKPANRAETLLFSKNALISMRNGSFYLMCRIADLRPTHLIESHVSGLLVKKEITDEGEVIPYYMKSIDFGAEIDGTEDFFQMFWPVTVSHKITEDSELYDISARDISCRKQFEIIVTLEGITPETGNTVQVRTSYVPNEILWGYRFENSCVTYDKSAAKYAINIGNLDKIIPDSTPRCSPKEWDERLAKNGSAEKENGLNILNEADNESD